MSDMREAFEAWFYSAPHRQKYSNDAPAYLAAREAWDYLAQQARPQPREGFVEVPVEPTDEMEAAAEKAELRHLVEDRKRGGHDPELSNAARYKAMLAARPKGEAQ